MARRLGTILVDMGYLNEDSLWQVLEEQKRSANELIGKVAVRLGLVTEDQVLKALGEQLGMKIVRLADMTIPSELMELVNETMATAFKVVPISQNKKDKSVTVALAEPQNPATLDSIRSFLGVEVKGVIASEADVLGAIERLYAGHQESIQDVVKQIESDKGLSQFVNRNDNTIDLEAIEEMAEAAPVRKLLNMVLLLAIKDKASDIHFEPFEEEYKMRYRVDGVLYELVPPPRHLAPALASRIKVMANLDIAERRLPQDGRIELNIGGNSVDIRVSTLPTLFGESVVLRILDRTVVQLDLEKVGMPADTLVTWREVIKKPNGIILVTGPTVVGQDDDPVRDAQRAELDRGQDHHDRGAGRVRHRRPDPGADQQRDRRDVRRLPAGDPPAGPGQDPGRRDPRPGDVRDRGAGVADRPHRLQHAAHQRRPLGRHPAPRHGPADRSSSPRRPRPCWRSGWSGGSA